jgi:hypothetical protein
MKLDLEKIMRNAASEGRIDANETVGFARQFEHIMVEVQMAEGVTLKARQLFPVITEVSPEDDTYTYRQFAAVGKAKIGNLDANDIPTVSTFGKEFPAPVKNITMGYTYTIDDLRKAARQGALPLDAEKGLAVRRAINEAEEEIAFKGDTNYLLPGLFSAGSGIIPATKVSSVSWDNNAVTPEEMCLDLDALFGTTFAATVGADVADTLVLGTKGYLAITQKRQSPTFRDDTVMAYYLRTSPFCKRIEHAAYLDDAGATGKERIFVYKKNPSNVALIVPVEFEQLAPQPKGFVFHVACRSKIGGLMIRKPKSIAYMDGCINATSSLLGNVIS